MTTSAKREYMRLWRRRNPAKIKEYSHRRHLKIYERKTETIYFNGRRFNKKKSTVQTANDSL